MGEDVHINQQGPICWITLDRPKANAIDCATSRKLHAALLAHENNQNSRVAIIRGAGNKFFSAGWDLKAAAKGEAVDADHGAGGFAGITEWFARRKPIIAAVNGLAVGGGFELALACDLVVAAEHAQFFLPETGIGILPDSGGLVRLARRLPRAIMIEIVLTGKRLDAQQALQLGLVNQVVLGAELEQAAERLAQKLILSAPLSHGAALELLQATETLSVQQAFYYQRNGDLPQYRRMLQSYDAREGIAAFSENRPPVWQGR